MQYYNIKKQNAEKQLLVAKEGVSPALRPPSTPARAPSFQPPFFLVAASPGLSLPGVGFCFFPSCCSS